MKNEEETISVVINTYNAANYLVQMLEGVKSFDEVLICDMESTDNTREIAEREGCKVVVFPRSNHKIVEPARDFAIHQARCPWVLVVDADEQVPKALRDYLYDFILHPKGIVGLKIPRKNHFMGHFMHGAYPDMILRFFRKDQCFWPPVIHTQPLVRGQVMSIPGSRKDLAFVHLSNESVQDRLEKMGRYTDYEVARRCAKHYSWAAFFYRPLHRFLKSYIFKGGFRDGYPGFIFALLDAFYQVVVLSKLKEHGS